MTQNGLPFGEHSAAGSAPALPLVTIVVVNYNYGRFLQPLVASIRAQTYRNIECVVVDDASTDDSLDILDALAEDQGLPLTIVQRKANGGQTPSSLDGLAASRGAYVIFVDGDDVLLPRCVESHVYAHLSLRPHVGFTSGDMLQVVGGQIVVAGGEDFNRYIRSGKGLKAGSVRPFLGVPGDETRFADAARRLDGRIHLVAPLGTRWVWSPTSGNCYRRDALLLFADNPELATLRTGTDMYFAHAIGALCGSALIDEPVFAYRIHDGNIYTQRAQLDRTLAFKPGGSGDSNDRARLAIIDHLVAMSARFAPNIWLKLNLVVLLVRLDRPDPDPALSGWQRRSRLGRRLVEHRASVESTLGPWLTLFLLVFSGAPLRR